MTDIQLDNLIEIETQCTVDSSLDELQEVSTEDSLNIEELNRNFEKEIAYFAEKSVDFLKNMLEEKDFPWLTTLLEAYSVIDAGVQDLIDKSHKEGKNLACFMGCSICCSQDVPISPLEALGIYFAVHYRLAGSIKDKVHAQLQAQAGNITWDKGHCPFLVNGICSIYSLRPIACRNYLAFNKCCVEVKDTQEERLVYNNSLQNFQLPSNAALQLAYAHMSTACANLGIIEDGILLNFDTSRDLFHDIRTIKWLEDNEYASFFSSEL